MRTNNSSRKCFFEALLRLYHKKAYSEIQISEICRDAGYNRSTFYRIYPNKEALLLDGFNEEYAREYYKTIPPFITETKAIYTRNVELLFSFIRKHPDFFLMMRDAHLVNEMYLLFRELYPYDVASGECSLYSRNFLAAGYLSVIYGWLDDGMKQSDRHMAELVVEVINSIQVL